jgi:hypothetical protein
MQTPSFAETALEAGNGHTLAVLDGQIFTAAIVKDEQGATPSDPLIDRLQFVDGHFSSEICERYGFVAAPYWIRGEADKIEFHAVLQSPTDGTMVWQGTITDGVLDGTMTWTRERWYWTIEAEHRIAGERLKAAERDPGAD